MKNFIQKIFTVLILGLIVVSCSTGGSENFDDREIQTAYCSEEELALRKSAYSIIENPESWAFEYPSGTEEGGMLTISNLTEDLKSKYFSLFESENGNNYIRFSLDASDKGKSIHGSSVRSELRNKIYWPMNGKREHSYSFYITSTNFAEARFTVGQFEQVCTEKISPLCRIELENGQITAKIVNYESDGVTKSDGKTHKYSLGTIKQYQEVSIKMSLDGKVLSLYRDNKLKATHTFPNEVSGELENFFKAGIYYQNKDSPKIFSEIFMRDLKVNVEGDYRTILY